MVGPGLDLNGARRIADSNDASKRAITVRIPAYQEHRAGMKFLHGTIVADSPVLDAIGLICLTNQSWI